VTVARLSRHIAGAVDTPLPSKADNDTRLHVLDTLAACVSGSLLKPGRLAQQYAAHQRASGDASILGTASSTSPQVAALANGMAAHADESDDSHEGAMAHIGCSVVPAALALAEAHDLSLRALLRAVALGYDIGARVNMAIGIENIRPWDGIHSSHGIAGTFGSAAAAASLLGVEEAKVRWVLSYAAQQAGGLGTVFRDGEHIEKAFVFGGGPARSGVAAAEMVSLGFTGVDDAFSGSPNYFDLFPGEVDRDVLVAELGSRFEVSNTNIKKFPVGSPMQAMLQALDLFRERGVLPAADLESVEVTIPAYVYGIVSGNLLPDVSARYLCAVTILDGECSYTAAHDYERLQAPDVRALMARIALLPDESMGRSRAARVVVRLAGGATHEEHVTAARGSIHDPMTRGEVERKAVSLLSPALGAAAARGCVDFVLDGDDALPARALGDLCRAPEPVR
jgi:2-methylcitrate dehydratase PrpD